MEFGLFVVNMDFAGLRRIAREAEQLGYNLVVCPDHFVQQGPEGEYDPHCLAYEPLFSVAAMAESTSKIKLGNLVLCNLFRHPAVTARALASLDHLTGGRIIAGMGAGWTALEFRMTGIAFPEVPTRLEMLDEALGCMRMLWTNEQSTFAGRHYQLREAILWPKPLQKPYPQLIVGGSGKGLLRVAAKHADMVNIIIDVGRTDVIKLSSMARLTDQSFGRRVAFIKEEARKHGRQPPAIGSSIFQVAVVDSEQEAKTQIEGIAQGLGMPAHEVPRSPLMLVGTPAQCIAELGRRIEQWGISQMIFQPGSEAMMKRLAQEVLARL